MTTTRIKQRKDQSAAWIAQRVILGLMATVAGIALCMTLATAAILFTETGSHWLIHRTTDSVSELSIDQFSGTLGRELHIKNLRLASPALYLQISDIALSWQPLDLLTRKLTLQRAFASGVTLRLPTADDPADAVPAAWPNLRLPLRITIQSLKIDDFTLHQEHDTQHIYSIRAALHSNDQQLHIDQLQVHAARYQTSIEGKIANQLPYSGELRASWQWHRGDVSASPTRFAGHFRASGDLNRLQIEHQLTAPVTVQTSGEIQLAYHPEQVTLDRTDVTVDIRNTWQQLDPADLGLTTALPILAKQGGVHILGNWASYQLNLRSTFAEKITPHPTPVALQNVIGESIELSAMLSGQELDFLIDALRIRSAAGELEVQGRINAQELGTDTEHPSLHWSLGAALRNVTPEQVLPQLPGKLDATLESRGVWQRDNYDIKAKITALQGTLRGQPVFAKADAQLNNSGQEITQLEARFGDNRLSLQGRHRADTSTVSAQLKAPKLAQLWPDLRGAVEIDADLHGTTHAPQGSVIIQANNAGLASFDLATLRATFLSSDGDHYELQAHAKGLATDHFSDADVVLSAAGTQQNHLAQLKVLEPALGTVDIAVAGGCDNSDQWRGKLTALNLRPADTNLPAQLGTWRLMQPAELAVSAAEFKLQRLCLQPQSSGRICSNANWKDGELALDGHIGDLSLVPFLQQLITADDNAELVATLNGRWDVEGPITRLNGNIALEVGDLLLRQKNHYGLPDEEHRGTLTFNSRFNGGPAQHHLRFALTDIGQLNATVRSDGFEAASNIDGNFDVGFNNLKWLNSVVPLVDDLDGALTGKVRLHGALAAPMYTGSLDINDFEFALPELGSKFDRGQLHMDLSERGAWQLQGGVSVADRLLRIEGDGLLKNAQIDSGRLQITGRELLVADLDTLRMKISPDLDLRVDNERITVRGNLNIDEGSLTVKALPEHSIDVSSDEQIVRTTTTSPSPSRHLDLLLDINFNKAFKLDAYGLETKLGGSLQLRQRESQPMLGFGTLSLHDATYKSYGQDLKVTTGALLFQGPLDNPGLNIIAVRETKNHRAGLNIGGTAQDIRSDIFSAPPLPPTDAMSLLVTGKLPSQLNENDGNRVINTAIRLGIAQSEGITSTLQERLGIDTLSLQGADNYQDSSLLIGKYLTPKLFVSYVQSLFLPAGTVQLDYELSDNLGLKAQSGKEQSLDLLYKIEHGSTE